MSSVPVALLVVMVVVAVHPIQTASPRCCSVAQSRVKACRSPIQWFWGFPWLFSSLVDRDYHHPWLLLSSPNING